MDRISKLGLS